ncbi:hypothetical protein Salat_2515100 [Sesamum alatum]|uniref:DUF4283 domain-containing protein n=1 Tax=Sesamum alatum TaxID=300844 RepID=A0AAE1XSQ0_9LAMI|nr:hypothetical protein Salat_2515100 [Sesamum alatum]
MDGILGQLKWGLNLTGDEDAGMAMPDEIWQQDSGQYQLCLVGRVLTSRAYNCEGMCQSVKDMLNAVKGLEIKQLPGGHFLLPFSYIIDKNRALVGCPRSFEHNLLILNSISIDANPMLVDLGWCEFHVQVHDLPLSQMNLEVATLIGNRIGQFKELELDEHGHPGRAFLRIRVALDAAESLLSLWSVGTSRAAM